METFLSPLVHAEEVTKALPVILMEARKGHDELIPLEVVLANQAWYWVLPRFDLRRNE